MKKINKSLIGARNQDLQQIVTEANFLENLDTMGRTPDSIINSAKKALNIGEKNSVIAEWEENMMRINRTQKMFVDVNGLTERLVADNIIDENEVEMLGNIEKRLGNQLMEIFDIEPEDLYEEEWDFITS